MTIRTTCEFCGEDNSETFNFEGGENPAVNQKLHRVYKVTTIQELKSYLEFLSKHIDNVMFHVHYAELYVFAHRNDVLDWTTKRGQYFEAIHHLTLDAHLHKCHKVDDELVCHQARLKVDEEPFRRFSHRWECHDCRNTNTWFRDDEEEKESVGRISRFELVRNPIHACTIDLQLTPQRAWPEMRPPVCNECRCTRIQRPELTIGRQGLMNAYFKFRKCICDFRCIDY